jgi:hypothetical protein
VIEQGTYLLFEIFVASVCKNSGGELVGRRHASAADQAGSNIAPSLNQAA